MTLHVWYEGDETKRNLASVLSNEYHLQNEPGHDTNTHLTSTMQQSRQKVSSFSCEEGTRTTGVEEVHGSLFTM